MKKNLILVASLAVAVFTTSCDNTTTTSEEAVVTENASSNTQAQPIVDNPNLVPVAEQQEAAPENAPAISFEQAVYDFGTVRQGEVIEHAFKFTNTGKSPLIIESASATCGCTVPKPPTEPIAPGESAEIQVRFNTSGKMGQQSPVVTVRANTTPNITTVSMKGTVESNNIPTAGVEGPIRRN
ncbi:DUF1573 domain-containing protein [Pontibacter harenae]|uniref:DUF1573 domain-containing protein n=1 Tax=Pontibacter harenae TaxID=2894083 RepID=UPI001E4F7DCD|nr:DUF1573 domain-containing protein [Pontibacter harenae]MCC9165282.1 DUF1573 domain-containing protein [Pontibacter harenae]